MYMYMYVHSKIFTYCPVNRDIAVPYYPTWMASNCGGFLLLPGDTCCRTAPSRCRVWFSWWWDPGKRPETVFSKTNIHSKFTNISHKYSYCTLSSSFSVSLSVSLSLSLSLSFCLSLSLSLSLSGQEKAEMLTELCAQCPCYCMKGSI